MSYILDALKKAERERGAAEVPGLMTVHETRTAGPRIRWWAVSAACLACAAVLVWLAAPLLNTPTEPVPPPVDAQNQRVWESPPESFPKTPPLPGPPHTPSLSTSALSTEVLPEDTPAKKPEIDELTVLRPSQQPEAPAPAATSVPAQEDPAIEAPAATQETPEPEQAESNTLSLQQAMARMNMTVLLYDEAESERMVFIDGRRYREGDYVDGRYLLEGITLEGAVLSYQGERAILQPKAR